MNILVIAYYGFYEIPQNSFIHAQVKEYVRQGQRVRVLIPVPFGKRVWTQGRIQAKPCMLDGAELVPVRYVSFSRFGETWLNGFSTQVTLMLTWKQMLSGFHPDVIHAHTVGFGSDLGAFFKKKLRVPLVVTTHGSDVSVPYEQGTIAQLKKTCDTADRIIAVSSALAKKVQASGTAAPVEVTLNGFQPSHACLDTPRRPCSLIQVGNLTNQKRFHVTLAAFAAIHASHPEATLTIIGDGPERHELEAQCHALGLSGQVRFLGTVPNSHVLEEMASHQFFVMPSVREGFGVVYLEAMASGCVTIGTEGEGIADFIRQRENGFLVPPDSPGEIVKTVQWCLEHPDQAQAIALQGQSDAQDQTWAKNVREYLAQFSALLGRN